MWQLMENAPLGEVVDLWGREYEVEGFRRWPDCWWGPSFPEAGYTKPVEVGWYCRLRGDPFRIFPTHFMMIPTGPVWSGSQSASIDAMCGPGLG